MEQLVINSVSLQDADFLDTATGFLDGTLLNRYKMVTNVTYSKSTLGIRLIFLAVAGVYTVTNGNTASTYSFINNGNWKAGDIFVTQGSSLNTGALTIASVTDTVLTLSTAVTNETVPVANMFFTPKITAIDLLYNLIGNNEQIGFFSKTDPNSLQRYTAIGLDTTVATPVLMLIGSQSFAWVTDTVTGNVSQASIVGTNSGFGTSFNYNQTFTITQYFFQAPAWIKDYFYNFQNNIPPPDYVGSGSTSTEPNALKYICSVAAKVIPGPYVNAQATFSSDGNAGWLNQNNARSIPDFTNVSIAFVDDATSNPLTLPDFTKTNDVTIVINSASGAFTTSTKVVLNHLFCSLNPADYQNTSTTMRENMMWDRVVLTASSNPIPTYTNGEFYGTDYSVIQHALATLVSANQIIITFKAIYAAALQTYLKARPNNRNISFIPVTE